MIKPCDTLHSLSVHPPEAACHAPAAPRSALGPTVSKVAGLLHPAMNRATGKVRGVPLKARDSHPRKLCIPTRTHLNAGGLAGPVPFARMGPTKSQPWEGLPVPRWAPGSERPPRGALRHSRHPPPRSTIAHPAKAECGPQSRLESRPSPTNFSDSPSHLTPCGDTVRDSHTDPKTLKITINA